MTILITGSSGFLGRNLKNSLKKNKKNFITISRNHKKKGGGILFDSLNDKKIIKRYKNKIDIVIHLACKYDTGIKLSDIDIMNANFIYGVSVFKFSQDIKAKIFINISSILNPNLNRYSYSKKIFMEYLDHFGMDSMRIINLNLDMMFGYQDKRFFHKLIKKTCIDNQEVKMTNGLQKRNISHVSKIVQQIIYVIDNYHKINKNYLNLGSNYEISIKDFVKIILKNIKNKTNYRIDNKIMFGQILNRDKERIKDKHIASKFFKKTYHNNRSSYLYEFNYLINIELEKYLNKKVRNEYL